MAGMNPRPSGSILVELNIRVNADIQVKPPRAAGGNDSVGSESKRAVLSFRAKPTTRMNDHNFPPTDELAIADKHNYARPI